MSFWKRKKLGDAPESSVFSLEDPAPAPPNGPQTRSAPEAAAAPMAKVEPGERFGKVRSALGVGTVIQGKLSFDTPVRIDGKLSGEIFSTKPLIVGETGVVDATVQVSSLLVMGTVHGPVTALERIEIVGNGELNGDVITPVLVVEEGARFNGACSMTRGKAPRPELEGQGTPSIEEARKVLH